MHCSDDPEAFFFFFYIVYALAIPPQETSKGQLTNQHLFVESTKDLLQHVKKTIHRELFAQLMKVSFDSEEGVVSSNISLTSQANTGSR